MRWDDLPRSDNIEDRRGEDGGESGGPGGFNLPIGGGGLGIGTVVVLGIDRLGIRHRPKHSDRRSGNSQRR